jgi:hypothetical protein
MSPLYGVGRRIGKPTMSHPEQRAGSGSMKLSATVKEAVADAQVEAPQEEGAEESSCAS